MNTRPEARAAAWLAALGGFALTVLVFYPGLMSVDSSAQYAQALHLQRFDDVHPPLMTVLWRMTEPAIPGPGGIFILFAAAWWSGIAAIVAQYPLRWRAAITTVLAVGLFPSTFLMLGHVWKDVGMAAALLLATAATLAAHRHGRARWRWLALSALFVACCLRHNALLAVLPLLAWLCWPNRVSSVRPPAPRAVAGRAMTFALLAFALAVAPTLLSYALRAERARAWTAVALWDLAAVSIEAGEVLLPASLVTPDLTVDDLRRGYVPYANPPLFGLGKIRLSFYVSYSDAQTRDLQRAWLRGISDHPGAYLRHRARLSRYLLAGFPTDVPRELVYVPERRVVPGTPLVLPPVDESTGFWRAASVLRTTPLFAGGAYLVLALAAALAVWRHADRRHRGLVIALAASAWANALGLLVVSGSAEFRYLAWTALAAVLAVALVVVGRRADFG